MHLSAISPSAACHHYCRCLHDLPLEMISEFVTELTQHPVAE